MMLSMRTAALGAAVVFGCAGSEAQAAEVYFPGTGQFATLAFEDLWPAKGDYDFNDAVLRVNVVRHEDSTPEVTGVDWTFNVFALGATRCSGAAIRLPYDPAGLTVERIRGTAGAPDGSPWSASPVTAVSDGGTGSVIEIAGSLRELCGGAGGFLNTVPGAATVACDPIGLRVSLSTPSATLPGEPGDIFLFGCDAKSRQIHTSRSYGVPGGAFAVEPSLYLTGDDRSSVDASTGAPLGGPMDRFYVSGAGVPWALVFGDDVFSGVPAEGVDILTVFGQLDEYVLNPAIPFWHTPAGQAFAYTGSPPPLPVADFNAETPETACTNGGGVWFASECWTTGQHAAQGTCVSTNGAWIGGPSGSCTCPTGHQNHPVAGDQCVTDEWMCSYEVGYWGSGACYLSEQDHCETGTGGYWSSGTCYLSEQDYCVTSNQYWADATCWASEEDHCTTALLGTWNAATTSCDLATEEQLCNTAGGIWYTTYCDCYDAGANLRWTSSECAYDPEVEACNNDPAGMWDYSQDLCGCMGGYWDPIGQTCPPLANQALRFDGFSFVEVWGAMLDSWSDELTVEAWVTYDTTTPTCQTVVHRGWDEFFYDYRLFRTGSNVRFQRQGHSPTFNVGGSRPIPSDTWTHVASVVQSGEVRTYVDGIRVGAPSSPGPVGPAAWSEQLWIGAGPNGWNCGHRGLIDDVRISGVARYDQGFAPETLLTSDGDTLLHLDFDDWTADDWDHGANGMIYGAYFEEVTR